jgi:hypothetical protein
MPQQYDEATFEIDHIIARQHLGPTVLSNLALSCFHCNRHKTSNLSGRDSVTRRTVSLFNPRRHKWGRHFGWEGPRIVGRTPIGRATVATLKMNDFLRVLLRQELMAERLFPPRFRFRPPRSR